MQNQNQNSAITQLINGEWKAAIETHWDAAQLVQSEIAQIFHKYEKEREIFKFEFC